MKLKQFIKEILNEDYNFIHEAYKELEKLKKKYPNIPYEVNFYCDIVSKKNGEFYSYEDQPGYIIYDYKTEKTKIKIKYWYKNGEKHRDGDKPASIEYYRNGKVDYKEYYKNGERHRDNDKPAVIYYNKSGKIRKVEYWVNGRRIKKLPPILQGSQDQTRRDLDYKNHS